MDDNAASNITQVLTSFDNLVSILENSIWVRSAKAEDIKNSFKLGLLIEKTLIDFKTKNFVTEFFNIINRWWKTRNRVKVYDEQFFQFACDQLLNRFFTYEDTPEASLEIAVRVYTSIFPRDRFKKFISNLIVMSSSREAITDFTKTHMTNNDMKDLEFSLLLNQWCSVVQSGRETDLRNQLDQKLSLYKIETNLYVLIGILSLSDVLDSQKHVQSIILQILLPKMLDRSLLSKSFWLTMFRRIELDYVCKACDNFNEFLLSIFNFVVYVGSMMKYEGGTWQSDETVSLCPEITYHELLFFIRKIYNTSHSLKKFVIRRLVDAKDHTESTIWDKIKYELY